MTNHYTVSMEIRSKVSQAARIVMRVVSSHAVVFLSLLAVLSISIASILFWKYQKTVRELITLRGDAAQAEVAQLTKEVQEIMYLPDETPSIATVTDKDLLSTEVFFQKAENGDKVLLFTTNQKAVLYRPSTKKVVEVAPLINPPPSATPSKQPVSAPDAERVLITLLNGSTKVGITNTVDESLTTAFPFLQVVAKQPAAKTDYTQSLVADMTGTNSELAQQIAQQLGAVIATLPEGELAYEGEMVVIIGNN